MLKDLYNILQWSEMPSGGHFAAMEEPNLLLNDILSFGKKIKVLFNIK